MIKYNYRKEVNKVVNRIKKLGKVIEALTEFVLKVGTLLAIIKMVIESLQ
jgi:hypothetical protein